MIWTAASLIVAFAAPCGVDELTRTPLEDGRRVEIQATPPGQGKHPTSRLVDGDTRTGHYSSGSLRWDQGASPTVTVNLLGPRLITAIEIGYAGSIKPTGIERRCSGKWSPLPADVLIDHPAKYPATSWRIASGLSMPAEALRLKWTIPEGSGQLTEIRVFGERTVARGPIADLSTWPRLPVAHEAAEIMLDLRNPDDDGPREIDVALRLADEAGKEVAAARSARRRIKPLHSEALIVPLTMPGPGCYTLTATTTGAADATVSKKVYVTSRELQFIWFGVPQDAQWATTVCNVSLPRDIERWRRQGVLALGWSGGYCYRDKFDEDGFVEYWVGGLKNHSVGIAIDEFGNHYGKPTDLQMANALVRAHRVVPDKAIVIWQAGVSPPEAASAYTVAADWIILECYMNYFNNRRQHFDNRIRRLRSFGLMHKTIMGLSCTSDKIGTTAEGLEQQVRYVRRMAPEMPGLGFYKAYGSGAALAPVADALCYKYFIMPTLLANPGPRVDGRVLVRNIGATAAREINVEFRKVSNTSGKIIQTHRIDRLEPDALAEVQLDTAKSGEGRFTLRVIPSPRYSCVSDPLTVEVPAP